MTSSASPAQAKGPLVGLKVLDISSIIAGPFSTALLADYGAEVLKLELPGTGDGLRGFPPFHKGRSLWWKVTNRNKMLATLDLRKPEGLALFKQLLPRFDVLVENFRTGTLDQWGLPNETLWAIQPRLVILRVTGFGQTGPYRNRPGFARIFEAMGGLTHITGDPEGEPMHTGYPLGDPIGGLFGAVGVLAACWKRARDPNAGGEEIDLSLTEATLRLLEFLPIEYDQLGTIRERSGNANQYSAPAAVYRTKDAKWVTLAGSTNALFANNCRAIGRLDLADDPRFATNADRVRFAHELNAVFARWCAGRTQARVLEAFHQAQGTIAPIYSIDQVFADPQVLAREAIVSVPDPDLGSVRMQNVVPRFASDPAGIRSTGGAMGQDNDLVYRSWLGLSDTQCADLLQKGVI